MSRERLPGNQEEVLRRLFAHQPVGKLTRMKWLRAELEDLLCETRPSSAYIASTLAQIDALVATAEIYCEERGLM